MPISLEQLEGATVASVNIPDLGARILQLLEDNPSQAYTAMEISETLAYPPPIRVPGVEASIPSIIVAAVGIAVGTWVVRSRLGDLARAGRIMQKSKAGLAYFYGTRKPGSTLKATQTAPPFDSLTIEYFNNANATRHPVA